MSKVRFGVYLDQEVIDLWEAHAIQLGFKKGTSVAQMVLTTMAFDPEMVGSVVARRLRRAVPAANAVNTGGSDGRSEPRTDFTPVAGTVPKRPVAVPPRVVHRPSQPHHGSSSSYEVRSTQEKNGGLRPPVPATYACGDLGQRLVDTYPHRVEEGESFARVPSAVQVEQRLLEEQRLGRLSVADDGPAILQAAARLRDSSPNRNRVRKLVNWIKAGEWRAQFVAVPDRDAAKAESRQRAMARQAKQASDALRNPEPVGGKTYSYTDFEDRP